jgi:hypothetical protein
MSRLETSYQKQLSQKQPVQINLQGIYIMLEELKQFNLSIQMHRLV